RGTGLRGSATRAQPRLGDRPNILEKLETAAVTKVTIKQVRREPGSKSKTHRHTLLAHPVKNPMSPCNSRPTYTEIYGRINAGALASGASLCACGKKLASTLAITSAIWVVAVVWLLGDVLWRGIAAL